ncbi:hypothetical protein GCM10028808_01840 [Spirosoma migulaei]
MITYNTVKIRPRHFVALTSIHLEEFEYLLVHFAPRSDRYFRYHTWQGKKRKYPRYAPQVDESLAEPADQLLFLLMYLKNNPLQDFHAALFGISQGWVSQRVHRLLALLNETLTGLGLSPCQDTDSLRTQLDRLKPGPLNLDATEREVARSVDQAAQQEEYSGKTKTHTVKNQLLCDAGQYVHFLSPTYEGKVHDKALADEEALTFRSGQILRQDTAYQGYRPEGAVIIQPQKKPRKADLSAEQKASNQAISSKRVVIEHAINGVKRLHCLSDRLGLRGWPIRDLLMRVGTALHNLRVKSTCRRYRRFAPAQAG